MAEAISTIRSLPGGCRSTMAVRSTAKSTATAPPPIARRTLESINSHPLFLSAPRRRQILARSRTGTGGRHHRRLGQRTVARVDLGAGDDKYSGQRPHLSGARAGAVVARVADR